MITDNEKEWFDRHIRNFVDRMVVEGKWKRLDFYVFHAIRLRIEKLDPNVLTSYVVKFADYYKQTSDVYLMESF